ncbi:MAG: PAS domain-containing protein, partial [Desulfobacteraceae bacterium]|nr:PAS domain-containing protein [Desulfobacteraceae bacterium]
MQKAFLNVFTNVMGSVREPLLVLDTSLKVVSANPSFYQNFCVTPENTEGTLIYDLGNGQWDIPKLRELLEEILPQNAVFNDFEVEHSFEIIGPKIMHLNARKIYQESSQAQLILLAIEDVTEREHFKRNLEIIVAERTAELAMAREQMKKEKEAAEESLLEIKKLKKLLEGEKAYLSDEIKLEHNH